ncbi:amino acid/polyamine transporter I [Aspergillus unguis]
MERPQESKPSTNKAEDASPSIHDSEMGKGEVGIAGQLDMPMKRKFSMVNIIACGYNISNSWMAIATSFAIAIQQGGAFSLLYGIIVVAFAMLCTALSLAEMASVYPTAGGQYHFTSILASRRWSRGLSYFSGLAAIFSWICLGASIGLSGVNALMAIIIRWQPGYAPQTWHYFLVYQLFNIICVLYNVFLLNRTLWVYNLGFVLSISTFLVITITCPARSHVPIDSHEVWTILTNGSGGWPNGISFLTALSTPQFMLGGLDATLHLAEECLNPERVVPKAVIITVIVGFLTAFPFAIGIIYSYSDIASSLTSKTGFPTYFIWEKATHSPAAATIFMACVMAISCVAFNAVHQTASRLTWSFARDEALFLSRKIASIHPSLGVPVYALILNGICVFLVGIVYVCSSTAFNSFISTSVIVAQISYAIPSFFLILRRRNTSLFPADRSFKLPHVVGYIASAVCIIWAVILTIFLCFPTTLPVTGSNMNYASVVLAIMLLIGVANWYAYARKHYHGPRWEL